MDHVDLSSNVAQLRERGFCIFYDLLDPKQIAGIREQLSTYLSLLDITQATNNTKRLGSFILGEAQAISELVLHDVPLFLCREMLTPNCMKYQLSAVQAIEIWPEARPQPLHQDDDIYQLAHPHVTFELSCLWAIDDFTALNGATRLIPNSHLWPAGRVPRAQDLIAIAEMSKGSLLIWQGATWHGGGGNSSSRPRLGVYVGYSLGWLAQEENFFVQINPGKMAKLPSLVQELIGNTAYATSKYPTGEGPNQLLSPHSSTIPLWREHPEPQ